MDSKVLKSILTWSLTQDQGDRSSTPIDPERLKWMKEAFSDICSQPSETDLLKAAIVVLKVHYQDSLENYESVGNRLEDTFQQIQYFVEDIDHANDLIPLGGVEVIIQYLNHNNTDLVISSCELIATASQNNLRCQQAFSRTTSKLLQVVGNSAVESSVRTKALYAVSCLMRDFVPAQQDFFAHDGVSILVDCLRSGVPRLMIKSLYLLSYCYSTLSAKKDVLLADLEVLVLQLSSLIKQCEDGNLLNHIVSLLRIISVDYKTDCIDRNIRLEKELRTLLMEQCQKLGIEDEMQVEINEIKASPLFN